MIDKLLSKVWIRYIAATPLLLFCLICSIPCGIWLLWKEYQLVTQIDREKRLTTKWDKPAL